MKAFAATFAIAFLGFVQQVHAFCVPGDEMACFLNGKEGVKTCGSNSQYGPCIVPDDPPPPPPPSGTLRPKYKVLTVLYAPPGKTGGGSSSSVSYGNGSSLGSTVSSSNGFKQSYSIAASTEISVIAGGSGTLSFGYSRNSVDSSAEDLKKTASTQLSQVGPAADGIDHNRDQIWLWLGPRLKATLPTPASIVWTFDPSFLMDVQFVFVGHLKDPSLMPPGVKSQLDSYGITTADYAEILKADPFAFGDVPPDPSRFAPLNTTFPYEPPFAPGDPSPTLNFTATHAVTSTVTTSTTNEYKLGVTISGDANFFSLFKASLKTDDSWTWTDMNSRADAVGSTESASVTIGGPSFGYTGPTDVAVYYDLIYKTFVFTFVQGPTVAAPAVQGVVVSSSGAPVAGREVVVVAGGVRYRTFTNAVGEFRVFGPRLAATQLLVDGAQRPIPRASDPMVIAVP